MSSLPTIGDFLDSLAETLAGPGVPPARGQARDLIAALLDQPRFWPSAHRDDVAPPELVARAEAVVAKLQSGMPFQYAVGRAPFRHLTLHVDQRVLIPRPETELLVDLVLAAQRGGQGTVIDVGTGSGAIALALAVEGSFERVIATDMSEDALAVARANLAAIPEEKRGKVEFLHGDLLAPLVNRRQTSGVRRQQFGDFPLVEAVVSNPPYISPTERDSLPRLVRDWEPPLALFAADDGMAAIHALVPQAALVLVSGGLLAMEVDSHRAHLAAAAVQADARFTDVEQRPDLTGRPRFVVARRSASEDSRNAHAE